MTKSPHPDNPTSPINKVAREAVAFLKQENVQVHTGLHFALKVNRYGETETGYLPHLKKTLYRHKGEAMGYGLKVWPEDFATVKSKAPEAANLGGL